MEVPPTNAANAAGAGGGFGGSATATGPSCWFRPSSYLIDQKIYA